MNVTKPLNIHRIRDLIYTLQLKNLYLYYVEQIHNLGGNAVHARLLRILQVFDVKIYERKIKIQYKDCYIFSNIVTANRGRVL